MTSQHLAVAPALDKVREPSAPSWPARLIPAILGWVRRARRQLAPIPAAGFVFLIGYSTPLEMAGALVVVSVAACLAWKKGKKRDRMFLSLRERMILTAWTAAAALWALAGSFEPLPPRWSAFLLVAIVAVPTGLWVASSTVRREKLSKEARALIDRWATISAHGPEKLRGSHVVPGTCESLAGGAVVFTIRLAYGIPAKSITEGDRQGAEVCYDLPDGTLSLATLRERAALLRVAISPARHLEGVEGVAYDEPLIDADGRVPLAVTPRGEHVGTRMGTPIGVMHTLVLGATGYGKSTTVNALLLPSALGGIALYLFMDGSHGVSLRKSGMAPFMTDKALDRDRWRAFIRATYAILVAREAADAVVDPGPRPEIYLIAEEAPAIATEITEYDHELCRRITAKGRKVGVGLIQIAQGANAEDILGGVKARGNSTQVICHRPLDGNAMRKALETVPGADRIDLMSLPEEPGWVAIIDRGQVWPEARVKYVTPEQIAGYARRFEPLQLAGLDLEAARPHLHPDETPPADEAEETPSAKDASRARLLDLIKVHGRITVGQIAPRDSTRPHLTCDTPGCPGWALGGRQTSDHLNGLMADGILTKEGTSWLLMAE